MTVDYATANGTATAPADYQAVAGTLSFTAGQTTRTVTVHGQRRRARRGERDVHLDLANPTNATIADAQALGTITDDDAMPALSVNDATVTEGDAGNVTATFTVSLDAPSGRGVTVDVASANGTATSPADYTALPLTTLAFAAGETTKTVTVDVHGDVLDEFDETYTLALSNATNATIADNLGLGTITDDDALPTLSIDDVTVAEGNSARSRRPSRSA